MAKCLAARMLLLSALALPVFGGAPPSLRGQRRLQDASCAANPGCTTLGLTGACCPAESGENLECCGQAGTTAADELPPPQEGNPGLPPGFPLVLPLDDSWWKTEQESAEETSCLMNHVWGCNVIAHHLTCLGSKDGRDITEFNGLSIHGQPCVWCGGGLCHSNGTSKCEPLDFLMNGEGKAFGTFYAKPTYQVAKCKNGIPMPPKTYFRTPPLPTLPPMPTVAPWWVPKTAPSAAAVAELQLLPDGCLKARTMGECLTGKDGSGVATRDGLKVHGQPCVWCGGSWCTNNHTAVCGPYEWLLKGEGKGFETFYPKGSYTVASASERNFDLPPQKDYSCLKAQPLGCITLKDAASCLSSKDGRAQALEAGYKVNGEPCVWCGGGPCTSEGFNVCEPFDLVMNGKGKAFHYHPVDPSLSFTIAGCKNERPAGLTLEAYASTIYGYGYNPFKPRPLVPAWVAQKPAEETLTCLKAAQAGCNALTTMEACMTSKDGRSMESFMGMKIAGEPCVWCGGITCTTNSTSLCEPFDYLMYGEGKAFGDFSAKGIYKVAGCEKGADNVLPEYDYTCLETSGENGCTGLWNAEQCLASKDGRSASSIGPFSLQNQPCVWCGGGPCHSGKPSLCEAFDYAVNGAGKAFATFHAEGTYRIAACRDGKPKAATLKNFTDFVPGYTYKPLPVPTIPPRERWWLPSASARENISCLAYTPLGCSAVKDMGTCLSSRDGRTTSTVDGLKVQGEPCVWCGGGRCHSNGTTYCEPLDYLMRGEGKVFTTFYTPHNFKVADCKAGIPLPGFDFKCLTAASKGCNAIMDAGACLESKDGRPNVTIAGLKVRDQPCVWCGGTPCSSGSGSLCEPYDYAMNGEGKAFDVFHAKLTYTFAGCKNNYPAAMTYDGFVPYVQGLNVLGYASPMGSAPKIAPYWVAPTPTEEDMKCLSENSGGCDSITEMKTCLSSRDGSGVQAVQGLKIQGEPCVWCGGGFCATNSTAMCLPFDYAMHGQGKAFQAFLGAPNYQIAGCNAPVKLPDYDYSCLKADPTGCSAITNPYDCLGRTDGRAEARIDGLKVAGQPCVWCGGGLCHSGGSTMCEPFDYVMNGAGRAFYTFHAKLTYRMAACQDGHPQGATLDGFQSTIPGALPFMKPYWWETQPKPTGAELSCLMNHRFGCHVVKNKETCLGSMDGSPLEDWNGLKIKGEPCVWCGGFPCQSNSTNLCEPYDFVMHGEGKAFLNFNAKMSYNVARCKDGKPVAPDSSDFNAKALDSIPSQADAAASASGAAGSANAALAAATGTAVAGAAAAAGAAGAAASSTAAEASGAVASMAGKDCWYECDQKGGYCSWCGSGSACCRQGWSDNPPECTGATYTTDDFHECVAVASASSAADLEAGPGVAEASTPVILPAASIPGAPGVPPPVAPGVPPPVVPGVPSPLAPGVAPNIQPPQAVMPAAAPSTEESRDVDVSVDAGVPPPVAPGVPPPLAPGVAPTSQPQQVVLPAAAPTITIPPQQVVLPAAAPTIPPQQVVLPAAAPTQVVMPAASAEESSDVDVSVDAAGPATVEGAAVPEGPEGTAAVAAETTTALATLAPVLTVAPVTVAPPLSTAAPTETTAAPATLAPVLTVAPVTVAPPVSTAAPTETTETTAAPATTAVPTLPPMATLAPATLPPALTLAPVITTAAPAGTSAERSVSIAPGVSTVAPGSTAAPVGAETTAAPPGDSDCWYECGEQAGSCPNFCGPGAVCCRMGILTDGPECAGISLSSFSTGLHHQCVSKPPVVVEGNTTGAPPLVVSTPAPILPVAEKPSLPEGPVAHDLQPGMPGYNVSNREGGNGTNVTAIAGGEVSGGFPTWALLLLGAMLLVCIPVLAYFLCCDKPGKKGSSKKKKKSKRGVPRDESNEDSFLSNASEQQPLVRAEDRSVNVGGQAGQGVELFDLLDANHDGVISSAEFAAAMGTRTAQAAPVVTNVVPQNMIMTAQGPVVSAASTVQPGVVMPSATAYAAAPGMNVLVPGVQGYAPGANMQFAQGGNVQYIQPGRPY